MKIFSLVRFFSQKVSDTSCWLAGRFYPHSFKTCKLKSQNLSVTCHFKKDMSFKDIGKGDWVAVQVYRHKQDEVWIQDCRRLSACNSHLKTKTNVVSVITDWNQFITAVQDFFKLPEPAI